MIEWVDNTKELSKFINDGIDDELERKNYKEKLAVEYGNGFALKNYNRDTVVRKYASLVNGVSLDVLRYITLDILKIL